MRGFSLLEVVLSCGLLLFLMALTTFCWVKGARAWVTNTRLVARTNQLGLAVRTLERELSQTSGQAVVLAPGPASVLAFPSAYGVRGQLGQDQFHRVQTLPLWSKYQVCYYLPAQQNLWLREVPIPSTSSAAQQAIPLPDADLGAGPQTLMSYATSGKILAGRVTQCEFERQGLILQIRLTYEETADAGHIRKTRLSSTTLLRN